MSSLEEFVMASSGERDVFRAIAILEANKSASHFEYAAIPLQPDQVEILIECCGVCHSDLHQAHNDWGTCQYPLVAGHEIIGKIVAMGDAVPRHLGLELGARVGVGPQTGSCMKCQECIQGDEQHCARKIKSYNSATGDEIQPRTFGGFADRIRVEAKWAFKIPDGLASIDAAPLLCAGVTTWMPFASHAITSGHRVGIIGIGGLGHVAIQFAHKLGCHVTAISTSRSKEAEARNLGADEFLVISDKDAVKMATKSMDFMLSTISSDGIRWHEYLALLKPRGKLCMVGLPNEVKFNPMSLVGNSLTICGSYLASWKQIDEMLKFCAKHNIKAMTEVLEMSPSNVDRAFDKIEKNEVRYRVVLKNPNFS